MEEIYKFIGKGKSLLINLDKKIICCLWEKWSLLIYKIAQKKLMSVFITAGGIPDMGHDIFHVAV